MNRQTPTPAPTLSANATSTSANQGPILVIGSTGKTGRRVVERLEALGLPVRQGSRSASPAFDWQDPATWDAALDGVEAVYVTFYPDLAVPGAPAAIEAFTQLARRKQVARIVLLSGRGEEEAQRCEAIVQNSGIEWTIVRAGWFNQNFSEGPFYDLVMSGTVALPAGNIKEPFIDADDIADVAVAALTQPGHAGEVYEVTGPRLMTLAQAVSTIAESAGIEVNYVQITPEAFEAGLIEQGVPADYVGLLKYLFNEVLDGRNSYLANGVERALGRPPRDFADYAKNAASNGTWSEAVPA